MIAELPSGWRSPARGGIITRVSGRRGDPTRTLLVISQQPHPWAFLRDRVEGELVSVVWAQPSQVAGAVARLDPGPWLVAGGEPILPAEALDALRGCLFAAHWVDDPPLELPVRPLLHASWGELADAIGNRLAVRIAGLRLAPGRGLVLPDRSVITGASALEGLLAAYPEGLQLTCRPPRLRAALRRAALTLERHRLPLQVVSDQGRVAVSVTGPR